MKKITNRIIVRMQRIANVDYANEIREAMNDGVELESFGEVVNTSSDCDSSNGSSGDYYTPDEPGYSHCITEGTIKIYREKINSQFGFKLTDEDWSKLAKEIIAEAKDSNDLLGVSFNQYLEEYAEKDWNGGTSYDVSSKSDNKEISINVIMTVDCDDEGPDDY